MVAKKKAAARRKSAPTRKTTRRNKRAFAQMTCPIKGCTHWLSETPGTVPGVKRHVRAIHGYEAFDRVKWPPTYAESSGKAIALALRKSTSSKPKSKLDSLTIVELRSRAKKKGIKITGLKKDELVEALS